MRTEAPGALCSSALKRKCSAYALALVQIGTGNAGPPGSEELEIDVDMSTMDLRLKRSTPLPRTAAPLEITLACRLQRAAQL